MLFRNLRQRSRGWGRGLDDGGRVSADHCNHLVTINLEAGMEPDHDVIGEHSRLRLLGAATLQGDLDPGCVLSVPANFAGRVPVQLSVHNSVKLLLELEVNCHVASGAVERGIGPIESDVGGYRI